MDKEQIGVKTLVSGSGITDSVQPDPFDILESETEAMDDKPDPRIMDERIDAISDQFKTIGYSYDNPSPRTGAKLKTTKQPDPAEELDLTLIDEYIEQDSINFSTQAIHGDVTMDTRQDLELLNTPPKSLPGPSSKQEATRNWADSPIEEMDSDKPEGATGGEIPPVGREAKIDEFDLCSSAADIAAHIKTLSAEELIDFSQSEAYRIFKEAGGSLSEAEDEKAEEDEVFHEESEESKKKISSKPSSPSKKPNP